MRRNVAELIDLHKQVTPDDPKIQEIAVRVSHLSKFLPDSVKALEFLKKFSNNLMTDKYLQKMMETIVNPNVKCSECADAVVSDTASLNQINCL